jgi:serine protease AprX
VGGYTDHNQLNGNAFGLYQSNFGVTADGTVKPEIVAPAMWVAAPILPGTKLYERAEALSRLAAAVDYQLPALVSELKDPAELPDSIANTDAKRIRAYVDGALQQEKIVAAHYQHVDGTSFAAPIVASVVAQMIQANPTLTPGAIKNILVSTADRIVTEPVIRQGYGVANARRAVELARTEIHTLNIVGCKPPRVENGRLMFVFHDDSAQSVSVAGDFNGWSQVATPLKRNDSGLWATEIVVPGAGRFEYKFIINGQRWLEDPSNGMKAPDSYGGLNSVVVTE